MSNCQGDKPPSEDNDDRLPPLVETIIEERPPPEPDPKIKPIRDYNTWSEISRMTCGNRDKDQKEQATL
jgi:hypothetical protein